MERKKFLPLEFEVVSFDVEDIVRTSEIFGKDDDFGDFGGGGFGGNSGGNGGSEFDTPWG